jgi:hypothetical protein
MKTLILSAIILFTGIINVSAQNEFIASDEVDEFTLQRNVISETLSLPNDNSSVKSYASFAYIKSKKSNGTQGFIITSRSDDSWQMLSEDTAIFIIDGARESVNIHQTDSEIESGYVIEQVFIEIDLKRVVDATDVRFKIGTNVFTITDEAKEYAKAVIEQI